MLKNKLKKFIVTISCLAFLTASCAPGRFEPPKHFDDAPIDFDAIVQMHTVPNVQKMDAWAEKIHKAAALNPVIIEKDGVTYIAYTVEDHRELLKQLHHGRLGWSIAEDMKKQLVINQQVLQQVVLLAKIIDVKSQLYRGMWINAETKYMQLEYQVKIDNIIHKVSMGGLILGFILLGALVL